MTADPESARWRGAAREWASGFLCAQNVGSEYFQWVTACTTVGRYGVFRQVSKPL